MRLTNWPHLLSQTSTPSSSVLVAAASALRRLSTHRRHSTLSSSWPHHRLLPIGCPARTGSAALPPPTTEWPPLAGLRPPSSFFSRAGGHSPSSSPSFGSAHCVRGADPSGRSVKRSCGSCGPHGSQTVKAKLDRFGGVKEIARCTQPN